MQLLRCVNVLYVGKWGNWKLTENNESTNTERNELADYARKSSIRNNGEEFQEHQRKALKDS